MAAETIEVIRLVVGHAHTGELEHYDGAYHRHDWTAFPGSLAPPLRPEIPIWVAANRLGLVRLAGEVADGLMNHLMWSIDRTLRKGLPALHDSLQRAGRDRSVGTLRVSGQCPDPGRLASMSEPATTPSRRHRIEVRVTPEQGALIRQAADLEDTTVTAFVLETVTSQAKRVVKQRQSLILSNEAFDRFIAELDKPARAVPELVELFRGNPKLREV